MNSSTAKKKKPKLLNKFDKTIKSEINAAEKLRKKVRFYTVKKNLNNFGMLLEEYNVFVKFGSVYFKIIYIKTKNCSSCYFISGEN